MIEKSREWKIGFIIGVLEAIADIHPGMADVVKEAIEYLEGL